MNNTPEQKPDFEKALGELEELVSRLESGELSLDESLDHFKRGIELTRSCQAILDEAQRTIDRLTEAGETPAQDAIDQPD